MKKFLKNKWMILIHLFIIGCSAFCICRFDMLREKVCPTKYWAERIDNIQNNIKVNKWKVSSLEIFLAQEKANEIYKIKQALAKARLFQENEKEALETVKKEHREKVRKLQKQIIDIKSSQKRDEENLKMAENKLSCVLLKTRLFK